MKLYTENFHIREWADNKFGMVYPCSEKSELFEGLEHYKKTVAQIYNTNVSDIVVIITSGDRAGNGRGYHYKGMAADIWTKIKPTGKVLDTFEQMKIIEKLDIFTGRGLYPSDHGFIHVDVRRGLYPFKSGARVSRWYQDKDGAYQVWNKDYEGDPFNGLVYPLEIDIDG